MIVRFGPTGAAIDGDVLGTDPSSDLAVVTIDPRQRAAGRQAAQLRRLAQGRAWATSSIAIGNPFGLDRTATEGIVSGLGRTIQAPNGFSIDEVIQTDAPINPGNSGGPLLDEPARVIGVNSQIATRRQLAGQHRHRLRRAVEHRAPGRAAMLERGETIKRA